MEVDWGAEMALGAGVVDDGASAQLAVTILARARGAAKKRAAEANVWGVFIVHTYANKVKRRF